VSRFRAGPPPEDRRCQAIVTDKRSKNVGAQCPNWAVTDTELCATHSGRAQAAARVHAETARVLARGVPEDVAVRENERIFQKTQAFEAHQAEQLERRQDEAAAKAEQRRKELKPPPLTEEQKSQVLTYTRKYDLRGWEAERALVDEHGRTFVWILVAFEELARREWSDTVHERESRRDALHEKREDRWWIERNRRNLRSLLPRMPGQPEPPEKRRQRERREVGEIRYALQNRDAREPIDVDL
jgi:hypothetical protein